VRLTVWHIGGAGEDLGPVEELLQLNGIEFDLFLFEIRDSSETNMTNFKTISKRKNHNLTTITVGVAEKSEVRDFFEHKWELTSSLLETSSLTKSDNPGYSRWGGAFLNFNTWDEITELKQIKKVEVSTISQLIEKYNLPTPDVISLDIQGLELKTIQSGEKFLSHVAAIITESEFFEIYSEQSLFHEQLSYLEKHSFRFVKFFGFQKWHPGPLIGSGFVTVTESLFIKYLVKLEQNINTTRKFCDYSDCSSELKFKIALVSYAYKRYSYFHTIMKNIKESDFPYWNSVIENQLTKDYVKFYEKIDIKLQKLQKQKNYFTQNPIEYNPVQILLTKFLFTCLDKIFKWFRIRGLVFRTDKFKGIEREME
jgi:FkbM family methyltransferase